MPVNIFKYTLGQASYNFHKQAERQSFIIQCLRQETATYNPPPKQNELTSLFSMDDLGLAWREDLGSVLLADVYFHYVFCVRL